MLKFCGALFFKQPELSEIKRNSRTARRFPTVDGSDRTGIRKHTGAVSYDESQQEVFAAIQSERSLPKAHKEKPAVKADPSQWDRDAINELDWNELCVFSRNLFKLRGYNVKGPRADTDQGVDFYYSYTAKGSDDRKLGVALCVCGNLVDVGAEAVIEASEVHAKVKVGAAILICNGVISDAAREEAKIRRLRILDTDMLLGLVAKIKPEHLSLLTAH